MPNSKFLLLMSQNGRFHCWKFCSPYTYSPILWIIVLDFMIYEKQIFSIIIRYFFILCNKNCFYHCKIRSKLNFHIILCVTDRYITYTKKKKRGYVTIDSILYSFCYITYLYFIFNVMKNYILSLTSKESNRIIYRS